MAEDLATLGVIITGGDARREIRLTREELIQLANTGKLSEATMKRAIPPTIVPPNVPPQINAVTAAIIRMQKAAAQSQATAMASQIALVDPFQKTAAAAEKAHLSTGHLRQGLTSLAIASGALPGELGRIGSALASFTIGGGITIGVLAGIAAIGFAWEKLTEKSRKAREEMEKQLGVLEKLKRAQDLGPLGEVGEATLSAATRMERNRAERAPLNRMIAQATASGAYDYAGDLEKRRAKLIAEFVRLQALTGAGEKEITRIQSDAAKERLAKAEQEANERQRLMMYRMGLEEQAARANADIEDAKAKYIAGKLAAQSDLTNALRDASRRFDTTAHDAAEQRKNDLDEILFKLRLQMDAMDKLSQKARAQADFLKGMVVGLFSGALSQMGGVGSAISDAISGGVAGAAGGPAGIAIGALTGLTKGLLSSAAAAAEHREQVRQLRIQYEAATDAIKEQLGIISSTEKQIRDTRRQFDALRLALAGGSTDALEAAMSWATHAEAMDEMSVKLRELNAQEVASIELLKQKAVELNQQMQQDLEVRRLRALGNTEEADALEFALKQQREYKAAVDAGADALTQAALAEVQRVEKINYAMGKIQAKVDELASTIAGLESFRNALLLSPTMSPTDQLTEATRQYQEILAKAQGGDQGAAGRLPGAAQTFLDASRAVNASGQAFQSDFQRVLNETNALIQQFADAKSIEELQLEVLREIRDGVALVDDTLHFPNDPAHQLPPATDPAVIEELQATVAVLQEGFRQMVDEQELTRAAVDNLTTETRRGFEGAFA